MKWRQTASRWAEHQQGQGLLFKTWNGSVWNSDYGHMYPPPQPLLEGPHC